MIRRALLTALTTLAATAALAVLAAGTGCGRSAAAGRDVPRVIVLGFDGMDYELTSELIAEGRLPHIAGLAEQGLYAPLESSVPPQSPVAWSDFITGMDAGGHGIFDFIHRDPATMMPYLSTSRTVAPEKILHLGDWQLPLESGRVELLRQGTAFWEVLAEHGVPATIMRIPANFPPSETAARELSGMGTPDVLGTYGTFTFYTSDPLEFLGADVSGGKVFTVEVRGDVVESVLQGPPNPFRADGRPVETPLVIHLDPVEPAARITLGDEVRVLAQGEWSDWVPVTFPLAPTQKLGAMCRLYLKAVRPEVQLYVSPLNVDPFEPALPVSHPGDFAAELARATGRFYTQGMAEDTKALSEGVLNHDEFLAQARLAGDEVVEQYRYLLERQDPGLLFYYFGNADQISHMVWRSLDPGHPAYDPENDPKLADVVPQLYERFDEIVGMTLERLGPDDLLVVMSDHGFTSWRRGFDLNAWLRQEGYLAARSGLRRDPGLLGAVDWSRTRAYGLGINALYVNLQGREPSGVVPEAQRTQLLDELERRLLEVVDPTTGTRLVRRVFRRDDFTDRGAVADGPDLILGYEDGMRCSNASAGGEVLGEEIFTDNTDPWAGDHCMDPDVVRGILVTNRPLGQPAPRLRDLAASILAEVGVSDFPPRAEPREQR